MKYDTISAACIVSAAILYAARYIAAALMGPGLRNWDYKLFDISYQYIGTGLTSWAIVALIAGVVAFIVGSIKAKHKKD